MRININLWPRRQSNHAPIKRSSWEVSHTRLLIFDVHLGYVNARDRDDALSRARAKFPHARALRVEPKRDT